MQVPSASRTLAFLKPRGSWRDDAPTQQEEPSSMRRAASALATAAVFIAAQPLAPDALLPAAHAHGGDNHSMAAPAGSLVSKFQCTPLPPEQRTQLFGDLGGYTHKIATRSPKAQRFFDEGLLHAFDFNQPMALAAFEAAAAEDPAAPAPRWGIAYALGPFLNKPAAANEGTFPVFTPEELARGKAELDRGLKDVADQLLQQRAARRARSPQYDAQYTALLERDKVYLAGLAGVFNSGGTYGPKLDAAQLAYAAQLEAYASSHSGDPDSLALAAEARANTQPWDFWDDGPGRAPRAQTGAILALLQRALAQDPAHPLAAHLLIHATEAGPDPGAASAAADRLSQRFPAFGHLTHMPSHTYLRTGRWHAGVATNARALDAGEREAAKCVDPYGPQHNAQMLVYGAMTGGELGAAERYARELRRYPAAFGPTYMTDGRDNVAELLVHARFAKWDSVMDLTPDQATMAATGVMLPPGEETHSHAMRHFVRALALAAKAGAPAPVPVPGVTAAVVTPAPASDQAGAADGGQAQQQVQVLQPVVPQAVAEARKQAQAEVDALAADTASLPPDPVTKPGRGLGIYSPGFKATAQHALHVATARLALLDGDWAEAELQLASAVAIEDSAGYTEPPRFHQPQRECLGWVLLGQGKLQQAADAYLQDLEEFPRSPWALTGLRAVYDAAATRQVDLRLPAPAPTPSQVQALLSQLAAESQGAAVTLPTSCPAFSEPQL